jgi:hypothetical protein
MFASRIDCEITTAIRIGHYATWMASPRVRLTARVNLAPLERTRLLRRVIATFGPRLIITRSAAPASVS